jgi:hypothetical protein
MFLTNERKYGWNSMRNHYRRVVRINWTPTKTAEKTKVFIPKYNVSSFINVMETAAKKLTTLTEEFSVC